MGTSYNRNLVAEGAAGGDVDSGLIYTWNTFPDGDATPSVDGGYAWKTGNTAPTIITNFDDPNASGETIKVLFQDGNTTIQHGANIDLQGDIDFTGIADDILHFDYDGSKWIESERGTD